MLRNGTARDGTERHALKTPQKILTLRIARLPVDNPKLEVLEGAAPGRPPDWRQSDEDFATWLAGLQRSRARRDRLTREHPALPRWASAYRHRNTYKNRLTRALAEQPGPTERTA